MFACGQVYVNAGTFRGQRHQIPWSSELTLWIAVGYLTCTLRTELWSSGKTASALNSSAISAALFSQFLNSYFFLI